MVSFKSKHKNLNAMINKISSNYNHQSWIVDAKWKKIIVEILGTNMYQLVLCDWTSHFKPFAEYFKVKDIKAISLNKGILRIDHIVLNVLKRNLDVTAQNFQNFYQMIDFWKPEFPIKTTKTGFLQKFCHPLLKKTISMLIL